MLSQADLPLNLLMQWTQISNFLKVKSLKVKEGIYTSPFMSQDEHLTHMLHVNLAPSIFHWLNLQHIHQIAAVNPLFHFTQKNSKPCGKDHSLSSFWFDISFYYFLPLGSLHCDGRMTWRGNTGTKWPSSASMVKAQSGAVAAVKVMMQWKPFPSYSCALGHCGTISG